MTTLEIVNQLRSQGHIIKYYVRKDGGILIKEIDGTKYTRGASGNAVARSMVNSSISEARKKQLKYATRSKQAYRNPKTIRYKDADADIKSEYKRVKAIWSKRFKAKGGKPSSAGYFGWKRIAWTIKNYGKEEALRRISEAERYATGYAYSKNVEALASFIEDASRRVNEDGELLLELAEDVRINGYKIKDEWIYPAYDKLYELNQGKPVQDVVSGVRKILRLL